ncbi:MAG: hypothetical protein AAFX53_00200 [Bacteroidota bacterium]
MDFTDSGALLDEAKRLDLYDALVVQLEKDFGLANIPTSFTVEGGRESLLPKALRAALHEKLYVLILEKFDRYLNLLYIIDVPEKAFKGIQITDAVEVAEQVCFLVLKREFQKVWYRENPSSGIA